MVRLAGRAFPGRKETETSGRSRFASQSFESVSSGEIAHADLIKKYSPELAGKVPQGKMSVSKAIQTSHKIQRCRYLNLYAACEIGARSGLFDVIVIDLP